MNLNGASDLLQRVLTVHGSRVAGHCALDLLDGIGKKDLKDRMAAWEQYLVDRFQGRPNPAAMRAGVWVPAIPMKFQEGWVAKVQRWASGCWPMGKL